MNLSRQRFSEYLQVQLNIFHHPLQPIWASLSAPPLQSHPRGPVGSVEAHRDCLGSISIKDQSNRTFTISSVNVSVHIAHHCPSSNSRCLKNVDTFGATFFTSTWRARDKFINRLNPKVFLFISTFEIRILFIQPILEIIFIKRTSNPVNFKNSRELMQSVF